MSHEQIYFGFADLVQTAPDFRSERNRSRLTDDTLKLLSRLFTLVTASDQLADAAALRIAWADLQSPEGHKFDNGEIAVRNILFRNFEIAKFNAPAVTQGSFIAAASPFEALAAITKAFKAAEQNLYVIDPYLDGNALTEFIVLAPEGIQIRLLADQAYVKAGLKPACERWSQQYGSARPLSAQLTAPRVLHDRVLIVDNSKVFLLSQSFAVRSPATITPVDPEIANLKITFYNDLWSQSRPI